MMQSIQSELADDAVTQANIADSAVGTAQLRDNEVTPAKLATVTNGVTVKGQWLKISAGAGTGLLSGYFNLTSDAATVVAGYLSGNEHGIQFNMADANEFGGLVPSFPNLYTGMNLTITVRWQSTLDDDDEDLWIGLVRDLTDDMTNSAFPDSNAVFLFGKKNGETNWGIIRNDGTGTATKSNTAAYNTTVNTTVITTTTTTLTLKHNTGSAVAFTTDIPSSSTALALVVYYNGEATSDKLFRILDVSIQGDFKTGA